MYFDEMKLSRQTNRKVWSIAGWELKVVFEFYAETPRLVSLLLAVSPKLGMIYFEVTEGSVNYRVILEFCKTMVKKYLDVEGQRERSKPRLLIMDNARVHKKKPVLG